MFNFEDRKDTILNGANRVYILYERKTVFKMDI